MRELPHLSLHDGGPTPVRELSPGLWLKDDGAFGSGGWGGNKVRKLEYLLAAAPPGRTILTFGGRATNWGLATALYGREHGHEVVLVLLDQPMTPHAAEQYERTQRSGAHVVPVGGKAGAAARLPWLWLRHRRPWVLPAGGSTPLGAVGYVRAGLEIGEQVAGGALPEPDRLVCAVGTGGTVAGLVVGLQLAGLRTRVLGAVVNDRLPLDHGRIAGLAEKCAGLVDADVDPGRFDLTREYLGDGYGHALPGAPEGYDPVYTAKAMAAALTLDGTTLFLQTDGPR